MHAVFVLDPEVCQVWTLFTAQTSQASKSMTGTACMREQPAG